MAEKVKRSPERSAAGPNDEDDEDTLTREAADIDVIDKDPPEDEDEPVLEVADETEAQIEKRARAMGWTNEEEFRASGKKGTWRPAREFVERGLTNKHMAEERLDRLATQNDRLEATVKDLKVRLEESSEVLVQLNDRFKRADQAGYQRALADLRQKQRQAVEEADTEKFDAAEAEIAQLEKQAPKVEEKKDPPARETPKVDPVAAAWAARNKWFETDDELGEIATVIHRRLLRDRKDLSLADNLNMVTAEVKRRFPERFDNPARRGPGSVAMPSGDRGSGGKKGRTVADLPEDAKKALAKFKRTIPNYTDEEYLKTYEWDA